jgi:hypothetical protein
MKYTYTPRNWSHCRQKQIKTQTPKIIVTSTSFTYKYRAQCRLCSIRGTKFCTTISWCTRTYLHLIIIATNRVKWHLRSSSFINFYPRSLDTKFHQFFLSTFGDNLRTGEWLDKHILFPLCNPFVHSIQIIHEVTHKSQPSVTIPVVRRINYINKFFGLLANG